MRLPHPEILSALHPGNTVLVDDGKVRLHVIEASREKARAIVDVPGNISNRKGVSLPDTEIPVSSMTEKDRADLDAGLNEGVDWVAVSFVQRPDDIAEVKKFARGRALVMAKIEKPQAINRLDEIMEISDSLMVARGDLGVEMPLEKVPGLQKRMTRMGRRFGKPVVVATQMLESMISSPVPTRAEVSDIATAVFEGADAVMLSAESASGQFPVEAVATMNRIAEEVENDSSLSRRHRSAARRGARSDRRRRNRDGGTRRRRDAGIKSGLRLDIFRFDRVSSRARAAGAASPCAHAKPRNGAAPVARLGRARRRHPRCARYRRYGETRLQVLQSRGLFSGRRPRDHRCRRAVRYAWRDQHGAHRFCCGGALNRSLRGGEADEAIHEAV